jgi:hypothetical protein
MRGMDHLLYYSVVEETVSGQHVSITPLRISATASIHKSDSMPTGIVLLLTDPAALTDN